MERTQNVVVVFSAVLSVALLISLFALDKREPFLYEPIGKAATSSSSASP